MMVRDQVTLDPHSGAGVGVSWSRADGQMAGATGRCAISHQLVAVLRGTSMNLRAKVIADARPPLAETDAPAPLPEDGPPDPLPAAVNPDEPLAFLFRDLQTG